jgi:ABC-type amino acid transport substrate-binding protein
MLYKKNILPLLILIGLSLWLPIPASAAAKVIAQTMPNPQTTPVLPNKTSPEEQNKLQSTSEQLRNDVPLLPPDIKRILDRGKLLVSMPKKDNPPFFAVNEKGEYWGLDVELARGFAEQMGVAIEFNRDAESYNAAVEEVVQRKTDIAWCKLSRTFQRAMRVRYTNPYLVLRQALLINRLGLAKQSRNDVPIEETVQKLQGNIGVIAKSAYEEYAKKYFRHAKVISYDTWEQVVEATKKGEVVAAYRDELEVKRIIKANPEASINFKTAVISDTTDSIAIAVAWDSNTLLALLNIYLDNQKLTLNADKLLDKYSNLLFNKQP